MCGLQIFAAMALREYMISARTREICGRIGDIAYAHFDACWLLDGLMLSGPVLGTEHKWHGR